MSSKLADRIQGYQAAAETKLLPRVPVIITVNGRSFSKITSLLEKPYDAKLGQCLSNTMLKLCTEVEGAFFGFLHNDEIVILARNDQTNSTEPWFGNQPQKIASVVSSITTLHFTRCALAIELNLMGEAIFSSQVFVVPNMMEAINTLVYKQQHNFHTSIQFACFYELLKKYDKNTIRDMLSSLTIDEKIDLLHQETQVDFNQYSDVFRRGAACYKVPKVSDGGMKTKWYVNEELPIFTKDTSFLSNITKNGVDLFRGD